MRQWLEFNRWYLRRKRPPWDSGISPPELMAYIESHTPGRAMDLGCGTGTNVITLAQRHWQVVGVDFAVKAIVTARRKLRDAGVRAELRVGDVTRLKSVAGPFDLILDIGCFHALDAAGRTRYADSVNRLLLPGGTFLLYAQFKPTPTASTFGLVDADLEVFAPLQQLARQDGKDTVSQRHSAWLTFESRAVDN